MLDSNSPPLPLAWRLRTSSQSSGESREPDLCFMILWTFAHTGHHVPVKILSGTASPGMSFLAYPFKFRLPAKVDSRQTVTTSGLRELLQFFDPYRTVYRLPVKERCERFTYQTPKTLIGERFQTGTVEFDCYRSPTGAGFFRRGWNGSHRVVVRYEDRAAAAGRVIPFPLDIRPKIDRSVAQRRCSHESLDRVE